MDDDRIERLQRFSAGVDHMNRQDAQVLREALNTAQCTEVEAIHSSRAAAIVILDGWYDLEAVAAVMRAHFSREVPD